MIVIHHNDLDGRCAAAIVGHWVGIMSSTPRCEFVELDYAKKFPFEKVEPNEQVWIVDFSLQPTDMQKLSTITRNITWIDHHKTAIAKYDEFSGGFWTAQPLRGLRSVEDAACVLTWKYVHWYTARGNGPENFDAVCPKGLEVPRSVAMIGDYDAWHHKIPDSTAFYEGCKLLDTVDPMSKDWSYLLNGEMEGVYGDGTPLPKVDVIAPIVTAGLTAIKYRDAYCKDIRTMFGYVTLIAGYNCFVANIYKFGSLGFGELMHVYPICVAYIHDGNKYTVSLYTERPDIDVGDICKKFGGGGHKGAAGFVCDILPFKRDN